MTIKKILVKPYIMAGYCDKCGGRLRATGLCYTTYPAYFEYSCEECGHRQESTVQLDQICWEEVEEIEDEVVDGALEDEEQPF